MNRVHTSTEFGVGGAWLAEYTLTALGAAVVLFDIDGRVTQWNASAAQLLEVTEQQLAGRRLDDDELAMVCADGARLTEATDPVRSVLADGEPVVGATVGVLTPSGRTCWRTINVLPVFGADRQPRAALASLVNLADAGVPHVADVPNAEWQLLAHSLLRSSITADLVVDPAGAIIEWNDRAIELTGRNDVELIGCSFTEVCDVDIEWLWEQVRQRGRHSIDGETFVVHRSGQEYAVFGRFTLANWPGFGDVIVARLIEPTAVGPVAEQPTDRQATRDSQVFEHAQIPLLMITDRGIVADVNHRAADVLGRSRNELHGRHISQVVIGLSVTEIKSCAAESSVMGGTVDVGGFVISRPNSSHVAPVNVSLTAMSGQEAHAPNLLVQVTERVSTERVGTEPVAWHPELEPNRDIR